MKRFLCCVKGESSSNAPQDPSQGSQSQQGPSQGSQSQGGPSQVPSQGSQSQPGPSQGSQSQGDPSQGPSKGSQQGARRDPSQGSQQGARQGPSQGSQQGPRQDSNAVLFPVATPLPANCGKSFRWQEILAATVNFRQEYFLGRGNFSEVYRCHFTRTNQVGAAKIIQNQNDPITSHLEFFAEVTTLHAASHPNVIRLLGKCNSPSNRAIIYEFMPNGSLERHLYAQESQGQGPHEGLLLPTQDLDWETRMRIAVGVAEGLLYLHQELRVMNRDIKPGNILLDENFVPKLTDFGLATKIVRDGNGIEQQSTISPLKGTQGCMAPETEELGLVSTKTDVYSYGVLLLALFTGKKPYDSQQPYETKKLTDLLMPLWDSVDYVSQVVDVKLGNKFSVEGLNRITQTARMCIHTQRLARPDMSVVVTRVREAAAFPVNSRCPG